MLLLIGAAMSSTLYDPAFATLTRIFGSSARRQITFVNLCRRVRLHGWLACDAFPARAFGLARHLLTLPPCSYAWCSAERLCPAAHGRRGALASRIRLNGLPVAPMRPRAGRSSCSSRRSRCTSSFFPA